ncbi:iron ABC transporter permease [Pseudofrankia sp. BMG5.37]|uniref:FecCD family ABC transporter permease n=1 Tax=Pseudofrankia sp. BMG5.37 TaxID=3050035 RepID=UPI00289394AF|nr:iron ABC transporter permease [Pseudofrankia sp. BMG5.37]MDT3439485.1 iron ABC transporter permease [Pseudofrankia sp. BMG5.37]
MTPTVPPSATPTTSADVTVAAPPQPVTPAGADRSPDLSAPARAARAAGTAGAVPAASRRRGRLMLGLAGLAVLLLAVSMLAIAVGARQVGLGVILDALRHQQPGNSDHEVVINRIPRLFAGLLVGVALGLSGTIMQAVTRNPLADPGLLGVNGGAAFAVVCAISLGGITSALGYVWFAFAGALAVAVLVYAIGAVGGGGATPVKLALAGAAVQAAMLSATTAVLLTDTATFDQFRFWSVGSLAGRRPELVAELAPFVAVAALPALCSGRLLNALALGDEVARGLGQRVGVARAGVAGLAVVLCATATSIAGPIWFIGLLAPHLARPFTGPDHRWILPYAALIAPILLLASDVLGRVIARPGELQVGVVLAFLGGPFLIALVRRQRMAEL